METSMATRVTVAGIDIKVERAKEHIRDLELQIRHFHDGGPYEVLRQDGTNGEITFRVKVRAQPPPEWGTIIGDVIHNLRSALDYLVWQLVLANGKTPGKKTGFPICQNTEEFETHGQQKIRGVTDEVVRLVRELKPYRGGNDVLWRLHELDIMDKHKLLIPVGAAYSSVVLDSMELLRKTDPEIPSMYIDLRPADRQYPLQDGAALFRTQAGIHESPKFRFEVAFGEGELVKGEPILETLQQLTTCVEATIMPFRSLLAT